MDDEIKNDELPDEEMLDEEDEEAAPRARPPAPEWIYVSGTPTVGSNTQISWGGSAGAAKFQLAVKINGSNTRWVIYTGTSYSYNHAITSDMNTVQYYVIAINSANEESLETTSSVYNVVHPVQTPATPASISVPSTINSGSSITISWSSVSGATEYLLNFKANGGSWDRIYTGSSTSYSHYISSSYNTVQYDVAARNSGGTSGWRTSSTYNPKSRKDYNYAGK